MSGIDIDFSIKRSQANLQNLITSSGFSIFGYAT